MTGRLRRSSDDAGFTLVEFLVAMSIMIVLITVTLSVVRVTSDAVVTTQEQQNLNEEARQAINRMARDIRQAKQIVTAVNPDGAGFSSAALVAVRFKSDYDGDGCISGISSIVAVCLPYNASNPEDVTYCFEPATDQLYVIDNSAVGVVAVTAASTSCSGGQPLLAGNVSDFKVSYRSDVYRDDTNPTDGVTTWTELDEGAGGNLNGILDGELVNIDSVVLDVTMSLSGRDQLYRTQVGLRNQSQ